MSKVIINDTTLTNIADAIRDKNGETVTYLPSEMPSKIEAIQGGGGGDKTITFDFAFGPSAATLENLAESAKTHRIYGKELFTKVPNYSTNEGIIDQFLNNNPIITNANNMFYGVYYNKQLDITNADFSECDDCSYMFNKLTNTPSIVWGDGNFRNVIDMSHMFYYITSSGTLYTVDMSGCNFDNAKDASYLFYYNKYTNTVILPELPSCTNFSYTFAYSVVQNVTFPSDMSNCANLGYLFNYNTSVKNVDMSETNFGNGVTLNFAFEGCTSLKSLKLPNLKAAGMNLFGTTNLTSFQNLTFKEGCSFSDYSTSSLITLSLVRIWRNSSTVVADYTTNKTYGDYYEEFANSIGTNTSGYSRQIKLYTNLYNSLTDEQKSILIDKGYSISYGTT